MAKYRFKTEEEFKESCDWNYIYEAPEHWNWDKKMNHYLGQPVPEEYNHAIKTGQKFDIPHPEGLSGRWTFRANQVVLNETVSFCEFEIHKVEEIKI